jgi:hypothetical protein
VSPVAMILIDGIGYLQLSRQRAWMKHFFRIELAGREGLAMAIFEQFIHFGPCFAKTP